MKKDGCNLNEIKTMLKNGFIRPIVDLIYPIEDGINAYEYRVTF